MLSNDEIDPEDFDNEITDVELDAKASDLLENYVDDINKMPSLKIRHIRIRITDIYLHETFGDIFKDDPERVLNSLNRALKELAITYVPEYARMFNDFTVRFSDLEEYVHSLRDIKPEFVDKYIAVRGIVMQITNNLMQAKKLVFECGDGHRTELTKFDARSAKPTICGDPDCKLRTFNRVKNKCIFEPIQFVHLQEAPDELIGGRVPTYLTCEVGGDIAGNVNPGDRVIFGGTITIDTTKKSRRSDVFEPILDVNSITMANNEILQPLNEAELVNFEPDDKLMPKLIASFIPHISNNELIKESILYMIVGAVKESTTSADARGNINIFLVGDPGIAKSKILLTAAEVAPRGIYTSGKGNSAAGLTAGIVKDKITQTLSLEAGATVIGDKGLVCIDELDKMKEEDSSALHTVMEKGTVDIAKAGFLASLNARVSILAAANPRRGVYDSNTTLSENVKIPLPLLTRFDLIFILKDEANMQRDMEIGMHMMSNDSRSDPPIEKKKLTQYLHYVRYNFYPTVPDDIKLKLVQYYVNIRNKNDPDNPTILLSPRQLESIRRLSIARAKIFRRNEVTEDDMQSAIRLFEHMLNTAGLDPDTGKPDLSGSLSGLPARSLGKQKLIEAIFELLMDNETEMVKYKDFIEKLKESGKWESESEIERTIERMKNAGGFFYEPKRGYLKKV